MSKPASPPDLTARTGLVPLADVPAEAVRNALADLDAVQTADLAFLSTVAQDYGPDSTPAANLRELLALRKLASAVRALIEER
jgi:hypothetical protein